MIRGDEVGMFIGSSAGTVGVVGIRNIGDHFAGRVVVYHGRSGPKVVLDS